jgi:hypothetical protein
MSAIILEHMEQGSQEWLDARCKRITMSKAQTLLTKGRNDKPSVTRQKYLYEVASEIITGVPAESVNTWDMARGTVLEPYALLAYKARTGYNVKTVGLGYLDEMERVSASPDGLVVGDDGSYIRGVEIKCQKAKNHMATIEAAKNPKQFEAQMQGGMWVFGLDDWDYVSFCPEFEAQPLFIYSLSRDEDMINKISTQVALGLEEIDQIVRDARVEGAMDGLEDICEEAIEAVDVLLNKDVEIE